MIERKTAFKSNKKPFTKNINRRSTTKPYERLTATKVELLAELMKEVLSFKSPADVVMSQFFRSHHQIGLHDRSLLAETLFFSLRHIQKISFLMAPLLPLKAPRLAALLAFSMFVGLEKIDLGSFPKEKEILQNMLLKDMAKANEAIRAETPIWLYEKIKSQYEDCEALFEVLKSGAPLDIRVNTLKATREKVLEDLRQLHIEAKLTPYSPEGIRLAEKVALTSLQLFKTGCLDVQDEGSQLVARVLDPKRHEMVCDFCAGAGGKTLAMAALMKNAGRLYAFDINTKRLQSLTPRMRRAGVSNFFAAPIRDEHDNRVKRLKGKFDKVLVDAPCSGTGTWRRNPDLKYRMNEEELNRLLELQKNILLSASTLLKPGGWIVYATCSLLKEENQATIEWFLEQKPNFQVLNVFDVFSKKGIFLPEKVTSQAPYLCLSPHRSNTDGFFAALLQKEEEKGNRK